MERTPSEDAEKRRNRRQELLEKVYRNRNRENYIPALFQVGCGGDGFIQMDCVKNMPIGIFTGTYKQAPAKKGHKKK